MKELYESESANYPRLKTDTLFADYGNGYKYRGVIDRSMKFIEENQLLRPDLWSSFVDQYRERNDSSDKGWRGEYWGKMMRGACFVYSYTKNPELYRVLCDTVRDMMTTADSDGRISSYKREIELDGWDIWSRKYVLLGMQYFLEICDDGDFCKEIIECMSREVDCIIEKIGNAPKKIQITHATRHWKGLNSSSLLEPVVRLYNITGEKRYFDFAEYIVGTGFTSIENFIELAYKNELKPYQYPVTKAYEMTSCFEGLLEFYRVTGGERYKTAVVNFANAILESDFTVIGSGGCTHELFDHSVVRQANTTNHFIMQETCVTVTFMKFFYQLMLLTGEARFADAFETSLYNAYLGSINTEKVTKITNVTLAERYVDCKPEPLTFDSYSPLTFGTRGGSIGGSKDMPSTKTYYGCCACIGSAGIGLVPKMQIMTSRSGLVINLYIDSTVTTKTPSGNKVTVTTSTDYPVGGQINIKIEAEKAERFEILFRIPAWSEDTSFSIEGGKITTGKRGYIGVEKEWKSDSADISLDMRTKAILPIPYGEQVLMNKTTWGADHATLPTLDREDPEAKNNISLRRGPIMLAKDSKLGYDMSEPAAFLLDSEGFADVEIPVTSDVPWNHIVEARVLRADGSRITLVDYASAGKNWDNDNTMAVWIKNR